MKLYEELLIGDNPAPSVHDRIMQARETVHPWNLLSSILDDLKSLLERAMSQWRYLSYTGLFPNIVTNLMKVLPSGSIIFDFGTGRYQGRLDE